MSVVEVIQHLNLSDNEIQDVRLQLSPTMTGGIDKMGKFGRDANGSLIYLAGYNGSNPVINELKEYVAHESEPGVPTYITITKGLSNFKNGISINITRLLQRIIKDGNTEELSTWSSNKIAQFVSDSIEDYINTNILPNLTPVPILDETDLTNALTGEELDILYPDARPGSIYFSKVLSVKYTKLDADTWIFENLEIR